MAAVGDECGAMGEPQLAVGEPRGDSTQEAQEVGQGPGGRLGSASRRRLGGVQGAPWVSQVPAPQLSGDSAEEMGEVCQGPGAPGGLRSASRQPLRGVQGGEEMVASGGAAGSGPQSRGYFSEEIGEVCQGPGGLASASGRRLWWLRGSTRGSQGSVPQLRGDSAEDTGEVCQGPLVSGGLASASRRRLGGVQGGEEPGAMGEPREDPGPAPGGLGAGADASCVGWAQGPRSLGTVGE